MLFGHNYFNVRMNGKKVKIDTDKTEFTVTVKNGKATFSVEAEPIVTDECSDYCDYCNCCSDSGEINEVVVEDNTNDITKSEVIDDEPVKTTKTSKKKTLDAVC